MNIQQAMDYLQDDSGSTIRLGLSRIRELCERAGSPEKDLKFIHIVGSNGKGSTSVMIESVLCAAGYRTGYFLSPFVEDFRETFRVCKEPAEDEELIAVTEEVREAAEAMEDHPSRFELQTAAAFLYFKRKRCNIVILEAGMGGETDSTNVIPAPETAVITNIGLEHTEYLGDTLAKIARAKAGIIKPGADVICYNNTDEVLDAVREKCAECGCRLQISDPEEEVVPGERSLAGQLFRWKDLTIRLALLGEHQLRNAAVALKTIEALTARGFHIDKEDIVKGMAEVRWPVRFEVMSREPVFIIDCAHNPQCAAALKGQMDDYLPGQKVTLLMGVLADKDYRQMIGILDDAVAEYVCITPDSPRALQGERLAELLNGMGRQARYYETIREAGEAALMTGRPVVTCTSLYISGAVRKWAKERFN